MRINLSEIPSEASGQWFDAESYETDMAYFFLQQTNQGSIRLVFGASEKNACAANLSVDGLGHLIGQLQDLHDQIAEAEAHKSAQGSARRAEVV